MSRSYFVCQLCSAQVERATTIAVDGRPGLLAIVCDAHPEPRRAAGAIAEAYSWCDEMGEEAVRMLMEAT